jgi:transcriptional regulator with XRE-family HTH domain
MMPDWRERLIAAVDADPRSDRAISLAAKLGPNFVNELRNTDKEPSLKRILKLAAELRLSTSFLFEGNELTTEDEEFIKLLRESSEAERAAFLAILRARRGSQD